MPGNSTRLRTGTMINASSGSGREPLCRGACPAAVESLPFAASALIGSTLRRWSSFMVASAGFPEPQDETAIRDLAARGFQRSIREADAPFEASIGDFELPH